MARHHNGCRGKRKACGFGDLLAAQQYHIDHFQQQACARSGGARDYFHTYAFIPTL